MNGQEEEDIFNPFADLKSINPSSTKIQQQEQEPNQSSFDLNTHQHLILQEEPFIEPSTSLTSIDPIIHHQFDSFSNNLNSLTTDLTPQDQDVGFDGKPLLPDDNFFVTNNDLRIQDPQDPFKIDQEPFQQVDFSSSSTNLLPSSSSSPPPPSSKALNGFDPSSFLDSDQSPQPQAQPESSHLSSSSSSSSSKLASPQLPIFRPFGVTATLTSSNQDPDQSEKPIDQLNHPVSHSRPALPDILGGVPSTTTSLSSIDSRTSLPAFKKSTPKKPSQPVSSTNSTGDSNNQNESQAKVSKPPESAPKPYRPLGLKIAEPKPIIATPTPPPAKPPPPAKALDSTHPNGKIEESQRFESSSNDPTPNVTTPKIQPLNQDDDNNTDAPLSEINTSKITQSSTTQSANNDSDPEASAATENTHVIASNQSEPEPKNKDPELNSSSSSVTKDNLDPVLESSKEEPKSGLSILVPPPPESLPSLVPVNAQSPESSRQTEANQNSEQATTSCKNESSANIDDLTAKAEALTVNQAGSSDTKTPRTESEEEDERPLASVRQGLVQQQQRQQSVATNPSVKSDNLGYAHSQFGGSSIVQPTEPFYRCSVGDPQKMGMINDIHTVYTVKTVAADSNTSGPLKASSTVLRRFRDFVWLFDALVSNNPGIIVPPIPDKNLRHRFQEGFIAARRVALEFFLQKTVNHPMLTSDPDLKLFLESDSFSLEVKHRKPDSSHQPGWLANIAGPRFVETDEFFDNRKAGLDVLEGQLKILHGSLTAASKARKAMSQSLSELSQKLQILSTCDLSKPLRNTIERLAGLHHQCQLWSEEQSKSELEGLITTIESYGRLTNSVRLTFAGRVKSWEKWQFTLNHLKKVRANYEKTKRSSHSDQSTALAYSLAELEEAERRTHEARNEFADVSKLIKAEFQRFDQEKVEDFKFAICHFVDGLTLRQQQVVKIWQEYYQSLQILSKQNADASAAAAAARAQKEGAGKADSGEHQNDGDKTGERADPASQLSVESTGMMEATSLDLDSHADEAEENQKPTEPDAHSLMIGVEDSSVWASSEPVAAPSSDSALDLHPDSSSNAPSTPRALDQSPPVTDTLS